MKTKYDKSKRWTNSKWGIGVANLFPGSINCVLDTHTSINITTACSWAIKKDLGTWITEVKNKVKAQESISFFLIENSRCEHGISLLKKDLKKRAKGHHLLYP